MSDFLFVDHPDTIVHDLGTHEYVGVDTEFMREKTFFADLALVQIATGETIYCVDPLTDESIESFWETLMRDTWVVHSARQDIEVVSQAAGRMPERLFDTQIAAALLGYPAQMGYAALVKELFDIEIDKTHTRANWLERPLPEKALRYAADDVAWLLPAREKLAEQLEEKGRLAWAEEDSAQLLDPALYDVDPALAVDRLKGARNLRGRRRAAAARLAAWRESEALRANRPRQWIARDNALLEIATRLPDSMAELNRIDGLTPGLIRRSGKTLIAEIAASADDDRDYRPPAAPSEAQKAQLKSMQKFVAERAADLDVAAETVASKRELSAIIVDGVRDSKLLDGWRREILGSRLQDIIESQL
jgi:ribonuclease D